MEALGSMLRRKNSGNKPIDEGLLPLRKFYNEQRRLSEVTKSFAKREEFERQMLGTKECREHLCTFKSLIVIVSTFLLISLTAVVMNAAPSQSGVSIENSGHDGIGPEYRDITVNIIKKDYHHVFHKPHPFRRLDVDLQVYKAFRPSSELMKNSFPGRAEESTRCVHASAGEPTTFERQEVLNGEIVGHEDFYYPKLLPKLSFAAGQKVPKFIFFAGLPNSGQEQVRKAITNICEVSDVKCICPKQNLVTLLNGLFSGKIKLNRIDAFIEELINVLSLTDFGESTVFLNGLCVDEGGNGDGMGLFSPERVGRSVLSYPLQIEERNSVLRGGKKHCGSAAFPDVRLLAEIFEYVGFDFKVVVLVKSPLHSVAVASRDVTDKDIESKKAANYFSELVEQELVKNQLMRLDPKFYKCIDVENFATERTDQKLDEFVGLRSFHTEVTNLMYQHNLKEDSSRRSIVENASKHLESAHMKQLSSADSDWKRICFG